MKNLILCDSGLGGLDIAAPFFQKSGDPEWNLIYINAFPDVKFGFNDLADSRMQEDVFQAVLESMTRYSPAMCLIACNTLSIVWQRLSERWKPPFPVVGIVETAVNGMTLAAAHNPEARLLILGTATTVASQVYPNALQKRGINGSRIHSLACPGLAKLIEQDPAAPEVRQWIANYAGQAANLLSEKKEKLFLCFCCTHYGYAETFWREEFGRHFGQVAVLNPNRMMVMDGPAGGFAYHARIPLTEHQRQAMSAWFERSTPPIAAALRTAQSEENLFTLPSPIRLKQ